MWHGDTYLWRLTHGYATLAEIAGGKYSPTDPEGEWWKRVQLTVRQRLLEIEQERERANRRREIAKDDLAAQGREMLNKWAVKRGYVDWNVAWDANMRPGMPPGFLERVSAEVREMFPSKYVRQQPEKPKPMPEPTPEPEDRRPWDEYPGEPEAEGVMF